MRELWDNWLGVYEWGAPTGRRHSQELSKHQTEDPQREGNIRHLTFEGMTCRA